MARPPSVKGRASQRPGPVEAVIAAHREALLRRLGGESDADTQVADDVAAVRVRELGRGDAVGRYLVLGKVGAGGMGVVYGGYDPELDRKVALKLLHVGDGSGPTAHQERARLIREAQSMARLADPNVVTVHDVGEHEGQVFVAMEYVEGSTLTEWVAKGRSRREVLDAFVQAGRGLAAAHAKGLVHRDFKPDNVMVEAGPSPRVRVMDFGLALPLEVGSTAASDPSLPASTSATGLTRAGAIVGTPAYMAPEQWHGEVADARSDQFAFCVSLWEALHGQRPFAGEDLFELATAVTEGRLADVRGTAVPARLTRVLRRGLASDPDARFEDMDALLAELDPSPRRRPWGMLLVGTAIVGATGGAIAYGEWEANAECRAGRERFDGLQLEERLSQAQASFAATNLPYAETVLHRHRVPGSGSGRRVAARA